MAVHSVITSASRGKDPRKVAAGKLVFGCVLRGDMQIPGMTDDALDAALYYVDGVLFLPTGGLKAKRALVAEAKKRGVFPVK